MALNALITDLVNVAVWLLENIIDSSELLSDLLDFIIRGVLVADMIDSSWLELLLCWLRKSLYHQKCTGDSLLIYLSLTVFSTLSPY